MELIHADLVADDLVRRPAERRRCEAERARVAARLPRPRRPGRRAVPH
jgi:hypothetical protein